MSRRSNLASLVGQTDTTSKAAPALVQVEPDQIAPTPLNPRRNFGDPEKLTELGESMRAAQLQPCVVVPRGAYLRLWPEHAETLPPGRVVLVNGERRWRAAAHVGLEAVDAVVREDLTESREIFMRAVLAENLDRQNFDLIEQARGLESMGEIAGSGAAAAAKLGRSKQWYSQQVGLLRLVPELQALVSSGDLPFRDARRYSALPEAEQMPAWHRDKQEKENPPTGAGQARGAGEATDAGPGDGQPTHESGDGYTAVYPGDSTEAPKEAAGATMRVAPASVIEEEAGRERGSATANHGPAAAPAAMPEQRAADPAPDQDSRVGETIETPVARRMEALARALGRPVSGEELTRHLVELFIEDDRVYEDLLARMRAGAGV